MRGDIEFAPVLILFTICAIVHAACDADDVAVYNIKLKFFQENSFETGFQWANIYGQSHNNSYALYREGEEVGPLVRKFIQNGTVERLLDATAEEPKVYDQFTTTAGDDAEVIVLANGQHNLLSFICQMTSSPHWFVGVDSLPLCVNSFWIEQVGLELVPMDLVAPEDFSDGYIDVVKKVSNKNYDRRSRQEHHARVAKVQITKVKEYSTLELNNLARKEFITEEIVAKELPRSGSSYDDEDDYDDKAANDLERLKGLEEEPFGTPKPRLPNNNVIVVTKAPYRKRKTFGNKARTHKDHLETMDEVVLAVASGEKLGLKKHLPRHFKSRLHHAINRHLDCHVSDWSAWSDCTEPCGNGRTVRMRTIVQQREGEGRGCPHLIESKTCGQPCRGDLDYQQ